MDAFYMILPSNVSTLGYFTENTMSHYTTKLAQRVVMNGDWEVGLMEVSFTYTYDNIREDQNFDIWFYNVNSRKLEKISLRLSKGLYSNIHALCDSINKIISEAVEKLPSDAVAPFLYLRNNKPLIFNGRDDRGRLVVLIFGELLAGMLGFDVEKENLFLRHYYFDVNLRNPRPPRNDELYRYPAVNFDLKYGDTTLFFHCDVIKASVLGSAYTSVLRSVQTPLEANWGDQVTLTYPKPFYIPAMLTDFENVTISVKDVKDKEVNFRRGRVCVVLHFRKKSIK